MKRLAAVVAAASLTAGCWQPLYGTHESVGGVPDSVHFRLAAVDVAGDQGAARLAGRAHRSHDAQRA